MKRVSVLLSAAAMVLWATSAYAQAKPDFSGTWTLDAEKTTAMGGQTRGGGGGGGGGRGGGGGLNLKSDATSLTITPGREGATPIVYKLDGSATEVPAGRGGTATAKAVWEGNTIVITTTLPTGERKAVYAMEGEWLTVSTTNPGREGGAPTTNKVYYKKSM